MRSFEDVLDFWFVEHGPDHWFARTDEFDAALAAGFTETHAAVARGEAWRWRTEPRGRLAEIIVLDQFSRQLHRGAPEAFAQDKMALVLAQEAITLRVHDTVGKPAGMFVLMPFMHAESPVIQDEGLRLFEAYGVPEQVDYMAKHRETIARFGRFPFRNAALGRQSTAEEIAYMQEQQERGF